MNAEQKMFQVFEDFHRRNDWAERLTKMKLAEYFRTRTNERVRSTILIRPLSQSYH